MKTVCYSRTKFTLVELLTVISVIAILTSLLLPALNSAREKANAIVCSGNLKQTGTGLMMYCNDNDDYLPNLLQGQDVMFTDSIARYVNSPYVVRSVFTGTGDYGYFVNYTSEHYIYSAKSVFVCPTAASRLIEPFSGAPASLFISNYSVTRCDDSAPGTGHSPYAWWQFKGQTNEKPNGRRLNGIKGKVIVGEQRYQTSVSSMTKQVNKTRQGSIYCWSPAYPANNAWASGNVHNDGLGGNWLYKDGHVSLHRFNTQIIHRSGSSEYFMGL